MKKKYVLLLLAVVINTTTFAETTVKKKSSNLNQQLVALEKKFHAKIGIAAIDLSNHAEIEYRGSERFQMGCTSKVIGVAAILKQSMSIPSLLTKKINYTASDLTAWSPATRAYVDLGLTVHQLCAAAIILSDNSAMNLLVNELGDLSAINAYARSLGDQQFHLDRRWPDEAKTESLDDIRDSSTPLAMERTINKIAFGNNLAAYQRAELINWLNSDIVGERRIRAGVPKNWQVGDKTGTGFNYGIANDIGILWVPHCKPIILTVYTRGERKDADSLEPLIASATHLVLAEFARHNRCIKF